MDFDEARKKGGETTKQRYGHDHYVKIGSKGGTATKLGHAPDYFSKIRRKTPDNLEITTK